MEEIADFNPNFMANFLNLMLNYTFQPIATPEQISKLQAYHSRTSQIDPVAKANASC